MTTCPSCASLNADSQKFCGECGGWLPGAGVSAESLAAPVGGYTPPHLAEKVLASRFALEGERKLVAVMFCDIASATPLAARVRAETMHALLNRFFELALAEVHRYEGTINQFLGDGSAAPHDRRAGAGRGALFISYPVGLEPGELREGMTLEVRWADATDRFGDYSLPVFGPSASGG